jgi:hypothetical protein
MAVPPCLNGIDLTPSGAHIFGSVRQFEKATMVCHKEQQQLKSKLEFRK